LSFDLSRLRAGLKPYRLYFFPRLRSTNDHAGKLRRAGRLFGPAAVLTARQIAGRGRGKNTWWSSDGVLTVTFAIPLHERVPPQELPLIAGLSVRNAAAELTGDDGIGLKWPNDLLHDGRKLAGLLCERVDKVDLIGIGLNVNVKPSNPPAGLRDQVTSLLRICGKEMDLTDVLLSVASHLRQNLRKRMELPFSAFVREYSRYDALVGKKITVSTGRDEPAISGKCEGIDSTGRLLIRGRGEVHRIVAGMVTMAGSRTGRSG
jgi:BirA family transcriptional regulator, biotin operon repressor / biotin---[acetyl-CoA-carboxylase] ligase